MPMTRIFTLSDLTPCSGCNQFKPHALQAKLPDFLSGRSVFILVVYCYLLSLMVCLISELYQNGLFFFFLYAGKAC